VRKVWDNAKAVDAGVRRTAAVNLARRRVVVPERLVIGSVEITPATVLAPMAGVTDTVFRRFIRKLGGCGLIMTEFTSADGILRARDKKAKRYLHFYEDEHPISAQLFGSDPKVMAEAASLVEDLGFDLVDLNLGCPAKKVVKCNGGSGLLRDLPWIGRIFEAVRARVTIPFTVKFRAGWSEQEIVCVELAKMAEDCGLCAVALHARTREQGYGGQARWDWIGAVKQAVKIPVIGNGDIRSPEDACSMVEQTGCDGVMIGRTAPANPWIFRQIRQYCCAAGKNQGMATKRILPGERSPINLEDSRSIGGDSIPTDDISLAVPLGMAELARVPVPTTGDRAYEEPSEADRYQMIRTYFAMLIEEEMPGAEGKMKQFASWFTHGVPGGAALRKAIYEAENASEILRRVEEFFESRQFGRGVLAHET
jgi:tRNA-dihydrouridine synthase B